MEVRHGYTANELHRLASYAVQTDHWRPSINYEERVDAAYCAMVELVLTSDEPPRTRELVYAGREASGDIVDAQMRHHGRDKRGGTLGEERVNFARYWLQLTDDPAHDKTVDRVAMMQIWPLLADAHRDALLALAATGDYQRAADGLGLRYYTFCSRVRKARLHFLRLWHEGEMPSVMWGRDKLRGRTNTGQTAVRVLAKRERKRKAVTP